MSRINPRRWTAAMLTCGVALAGTLALSAQASAATIRACVKKSSGATRIVHRRTKCKHGERSLSWNAAGPKGSSGASGPPGTPGANGTNGAAAGFVASDNASQSIEAPPSVVLVSKLLPPGSYVVSGKVLLEAESKTATDVPFVECGMYDVPGTTPSTGGEATGLLDAVAWVTPLGKSGSSYIAGTGLPLAGSFSSTVASTADIICVGGGATIKASFRRLAAVQVSSLG